MKTLVVVLLLIASSAFGAATLIWQDNSTNETGFMVERQVNGGAFTSIAKVGPNVTTYVDGTATAGATDMTYCYRVRGFNATLQSGYTNVDCLIIPVVMPPPVTTNYMDVTTDRTVRLNRCKTDNCNVTIQIQKNTKFTINGVLAK